MQLNNGWMQLFDQVLIFFSGLAHCGVFQQRYVNPILFGDHAVAHFKGKTTLCRSCTAWITLRLFITSILQWQHDRGPCGFVHTDLMDNADNDGNLAHRDLECCRQYICWPGTSLRTLSSHRSIPLFQRVFIINNGINKKKTKNIQCRSHALRWFTCPACLSVLQTEAPLLIRPYLKDMTKSEIHAVMVGGFATIAGSVMGAFISFGVRYEWDIVPHCMNFLQKNMLTYFPIQ